MANTLGKTRKQIAKKRNGAMDNLHVNSRNTKRLHRAQVRDDRLLKLASTRRKGDQPMIDRVAFFKEAAQASPTLPLSTEAVQEAVQRFVHQHDEEYERVKIARRPGRPASTKEDLLKAKVTALEKEYQNGFYMPDLTTSENLAMLYRWDGSWTFLNNLAWVKVSPEGQSQHASFPPI